MVVHVVFPHAMYFDFEDACHPRPASPGSAEALPAAPAAKEVDEEKTENGVIDACGAPGRGLFRPPQKGPGKCVTLSVGLRVFG